MLKDTSRPQQGVQALETGLEVLEALVSSGQPMMLKDIASGAGVHPAKAHRYLVSFIRKGYVARDSAGLYRLGESALRAGLSTLSQMDPVRLAAPLMDQLCAEINESLLAAVWSNFGPTVVLWRDSTRPVSVNIRPGSVMPMLSSATGRVFTAFIDERASELLINVEIEEKIRYRDPHFPKSIEDVKKMQADIRAAGFGTVTGDMREGINAVSVPVFNHQGKIVLAITALGGERSFDASENSVPTLAVRRTAALLSKELGFEFSNISKNEQQVAI